MIRTRITRLGVAVAAAALTVPALVPAAQAAPAPKVPSVAAVAKVYPHFAGGQIFESTIDDVRAPAKKCNQTRKVKGATGRGASYATADAAGGTGAEPGLTVVAYRFPSPAKAKSFLGAAARQAKKCPGGGVVVPGIKSTRAKAFKTRIGDTSQGVTVTIRTDSGTTYVSNVIVARKGRFIVNTVTTAADGNKPAVKKSVKVTALAVKTAS
jgi:hypothetical protein